MTPAEISSRLNGRPQGTGYLAHCPTHEDKNSSLSIGTGADGKLLLHCHAGCQFEDIADAVGLSKTITPGPAKTNRKIVKTYDYTDSDGNLLFQEVRYSPKGFTQRRPDGKGDWLWNLSGIEPALYNLPAVNRAEAVFIVEGPKDAQALNALGYTATTNAGGAGKWRPEYSEALRNKDVFIIPDNDEPGKNHAENIARALHGKAKSVKILTLPDLPDKGDVSDFIEIHGFEVADKKIFELTETTPAWRPEGAFAPLSFTDLLHKKEERIKWHIRGLIAKGRVSLLSAYMKCGKSTFLAGLIKSVLEEGVFIGLETEKAKILLLTEEVSSDVVRRLKALGLDPTDNLFVWGRDSGRLELRGDALEGVKNFVEENSIKFLIVDTLHYFWGVEKENDAGAVMEALKPILSLSASTGASILLVVHDRKSEGEHGRQIRGSGALFGNVDNAIFLSRRQGGTSTQRLLKTLGRYSESPEELLLDFVNGEYISLGEPGAADARTAEEEVLKALGGESMDKKTIINATGLNQTKARRALDRLIENGLITRTGTGKKGDPFIFYLV